MSAILNYDRKREDLIELGILDESADYEVDITEIHYDPIKREFVLLTASGCSCWDGDYSEERFSTPKELLKSLLKEDRKYNPSFKGAKYLIAEAKSTYKELRKAGKIQKYGIV